jgi:hypothetical protein
LQTQAIHSNIDFRESGKPGSTTDPLFRALFRRNAASVETATLSLRLFTLVSPFSKVHRLARFVTLLSVPLICDDKMHI